jgi:hypothetical protein
MAAPATAGTAAASCRSFSLPGSTFLCFVWRHKHRLPRAS